MGPPLEPSQVPVGPTRYQLVGPFSGSGLIMSRYPFSRVFDFCSAFGYPCSPSPEKSPDIRSPLGVLCWISSQIIEGANYERQSDWEISTIHPGLRLGPVIRAYTVSLWTSLEHSNHARHEHKPAIRSKRREDEV
jgi:hypothetical protein